VTLSRFLENLHAVHQAVQRIRILRVLLLEEFLMSHVKKIKKMIADS
jgi:hypothetical protein